MITSLYVDGFKNLIDCTVRFGPLTCIAGENGVGKSNIFDAIEFLSHCADKSFMEAAQFVRTEESGRMGDPKEIFWGGPVEGSPRIKFQVEMIVDPVVTDDLGLEGKPSSTFLQYTLVIRYDQAKGDARVGRIVLEEEELTYLKKSESGRLLGFPHDRTSFRDSVIKPTTRTNKFISMGDRNGVPVVQVSQDQNSGRPQPRPVANAGRANISTASTIDQPTMMAARNEMRKWRRIALEPTALRAPSSFNAPSRIDEQGANLAAALHRILGNPDTAPQVEASILNRLSQLTGVAAKRLWVDRDEVREALTLKVEDRTGLTFPARALSEGTLRFLALCILLEDPEFTGVVCMEEPENGIHPANIDGMIDLLYDIAVDASMAPEADNPLRQVVVNTHSPWVVRLVKDADLLLARNKLVGRGLSGQILVLSALTGTWRDGGGESAYHKSDLMPYLIAPPGAQLSLDAEMLLEGAGQ